MENYEAWQQHSSNPSSSWSVPANAGLPLHRRTSADSSTNNKQESDEDDMKLPAVASSKRSLEEPDSLNDDDDDEQGRRKRVRSVDDSDNRSVTSEGWSEETHRQFVNAIYEVGMAHASPSVIMENMTKSHQALTSERIKSHLQKYRNNKAKSKEEFLTEYESWLQKALTVGAASGSDSNLSSPGSLIKMMGTSELLGGELAAFLTYASLTEDQPDRSGTHEDPTLTSFSSTMIPPANLASELAKYEVGAKVPFPILTDEERKSHLGASISHLVGLFYSMTNFIMKSRQEKIKDEEEAECEDESPPLKKTDSLWLGANATDEPDKQAGEQVPQSNSGGPYRYMRGTPTNGHGQHGGRRDMNYNPGAAAQHGFQAYNYNPYPAGGYPMGHFSFGEPPSGPRSSDNYHQQRSKRHH